jgi:hypothetical protein
VRAGRAGRARVDLHRGGGAAVRRPAGALRDHRPDRRHLRGRPEGPAGGAGAARPAALLQPPRPGADPADARPGRAVRGRGGGVRTLAGDPVAARPRAVVPGDRRVRDPRHPARAQPRAGGPGRGDGDHAGVALPGPRCRPQDHRGGRRHRAGPRPDRRPGGRLRRRRLADGPGQRGRAERQLRRRRAVAARPAAGGHHPGRARGAGRRHRVAGLAGVRAAPGRPRGRVRRAGQQRWRSAATTSRPP